MKWKQTDELIVTLQFSEIWLKIRSKVLADEHFGEKGRMPAYPKIRAAIFQVTAPLPEVPSSWTLFLSLALLAFSVRFYYWDSD